MLVNISRRIQVRRLCATPAPLALPKPKTETVAKPSSGGSTFFQRFTAFLSGVGISSLVSFYYIDQELKDSNNKFASQLGAIENRLNDIERKKNN